MRKAKVYMHKELAGYLTETEDGYSFLYDMDYLTGSKAKPVSLTLPFRINLTLAKQCFLFLMG